MPYALKEDELLKSLATESAFRIDVDKSFSLPTEDDFMREAISPETMNQITETLANSKSSKGPLFYVDDNLYSTTPGYYPEANIIVVRAKPLIPGLGGSTAVQQAAQRADNVNEFDGDTVYFALETVEDGGVPIKVGDTEYLNFRSYVSKNSTTGDPDKFGVRFLGINCPEVPHYTIIPDDPKLIRKEFSIEWLKKEDPNGDRYRRDKARVRTSDTATFIQLGGDYKEYWTEIIDSNYRDDLIESNAETKSKTFLKVISKDEGTGVEEYEKAGLEAKNYVREAVLGAEDILIMIDHKTINRKSGDYPKDYVDNFWDDFWNPLQHPYDMVLRIWSDFFSERGYRYLGYNSLGQDAYKRFLGCVYVKKPMEEFGGKSVWINVNKYVMYKTGSQVKPLPSYTSSPVQDKDYNYAADAFKLWTYEKNSEKVVDALTTMSKNDLDDRRRIQKLVTGNDWDNMKDYTVMIGDCLFMVPPTSIRVVNQTSNERVPLLRSRGSMVKGSQKSERLIEMHLYFNNDAGINGTPTVDSTGKSYITLPNGESVTYYMNGLRQLIAMFKLTPFLPIESRYINEKMHIEAVSLVNIQVSTVPGYPRCMAAVLTLEEFNYHMYMPEIPTPSKENGDDLNKNLFASTINYELMRWHYQRPIIRGNKIADWDFNSEDYIAETFGSKTALQPMQFKSSAVEFYTLDKEYLDQQKKLKLEAIKSPIATQTVISDSAKAWAKQLYYIYNQVMMLASNTEFKNLLAEMNSPVNGKSPIMNLTGTTLTKKETNRSANLLQRTKIERSLLDTDPTYMDYADRMYTIVKSVMGNYIVDLKMDNDESGDGSSYAAKWYLDIGIPTDDIDSTVDLASFIKVMTAELGVTTASYWVNNRVRLEVSALFNRSGINMYADLSSDFKFNSSSPGMKFLAKCASAYGPGVATDADATEATSGVASDVMLQYLTSEKESIDVETMKTLKFRKYEIGDVNITNIACVFGNTMSKMSLKALDGYAPQYCGGQDTAIEITIQTRDENAVSLLTLMPRMAAQYVRDYRLVLPCWPVRINSEITRMLGVNEVLIESVDTTTVQGYPGLFNVVMRLISVDRTVRNKEALRKLQKYNPETGKYESLNNSGSISLESAITTATKTYFDLNQTLAQAELYPDLELPTLNELRNAGFRFLRYSNIDGTRLYPDPDFYFVYAHILGHEMIRSAIMQFAGDNTSFQLTDRYGAAVSIKPVADRGYEVTEENEQAKAIKKTKANVDAMVKDIIGKRDKNPTSNNNLIKMYNNMEMFDTWDVSKDVRCMFRERKYRRIINDKDKYYLAIKERADQIIKIIDEEILSKPIERISGTPAWNAKKYVNEIRKGNQYETFLKAVEDVVPKFVTTGSMGKILQAMGTDASNLKKLWPMVAAAADAASGEMEYENKAKKKDWQAQMYINPEGIMTSAVTGKYDASAPDDTPLVPYVRVENRSQNNVGRMFATSLEEAVKNGVSFGPFQIKSYSKKEIEAFTGKAINQPGGGFFLDPYYRNVQLTDGVNCEEIQKYKRWISMDMEASIIAFMRNVLVWMKYLLENEILLSIFEIVQNQAINELMKNNIMSYADPNGDPAQVTATQEELEREAQEFEDSLKNKTKEEQEAAKKAREEAEKKAKELNDQQGVLAMKIQSMLQESKPQLASGKFFACIIAALSSGNEQLLQLMKDHEYDKLNQLVRGAQLPTSAVMPILRKYVLALVGRDVVDKIENIGAQSQSVSEVLGTIANEVYSINAAEDPTKYILHSWYDMIVNDKRGRMARAFPSFYMLFIDEGREIGLWKLHDNFYNMSAISEIQVTKSRKIAADTARIVMTNMFKTYTTDDEDAKELALDNDVLKNYQYTYRDAWNSIFSPRTYFLQEELKRMQAMPAERARMKPGVRIHLRMGYSADASQLPILFNGVVAEVGTGEVIEIVAQGDGVELTNPILSTSDAEDVQHQDSFTLSRVFKNWFTKGATPRTILGSLLTTRGGWLKKEIHNYTDGRFFNDNPYGIVHFGEPLYKEIFHNGEVVQNIYEGSNKPLWNDEEIIKSQLTEEYALNDAPRLSTQVFGKSYWDIMHICRGASPDYIASVVPFGLRSSIFFGAPRYYYAYEYVKENANATTIASIKAQIAAYEATMAKAGLTEEEYEKAYEDLKKLKTQLLSLNSSNYIIKEKRKPFQQYHLYTSYGDIIANNITASDRDVRTCAIGLYQSQGIFGSENMERVGPLWVDFDIYPERQKTMTVDTQLVAKGATVLGDIVPYMNWVQNQVGGKPGSFFQSGYEVAWRMTATALKDSIKDMYQGELIIIGDPSVKPYDKMWIDDMYENIKGCCEVEAVVHNFDVQNGFTTSVFADCIATIDDQHERVAQSKGGHLAGIAGSVYMGVAGTSYLFATRSRPFLNSLISYAGKNGTMAASAVNSIAELLGAEDLLNNESWLKGLNKASQWAGISTTSWSYTAYMNNLSEWKNAIRDIDAKAIKSVADLSGYYESMSEALNTIDPDKFLAELEKAKDAATNATDVAKVEEAIQQVTAKKQEIAGIMEAISKEASTTLVNDSELQAIINVINGDIRDMDKESSNYKMLAKAAEDLKECQGLKNVDELSRMANALKVAGDKISDIDKLVDVEDMAAKASRIITSFEAKMVTVTDEFEDLMKSSKNIIRAAKILGGAGKLAVTGMLISAALEIAVTTILTAFAYEYIERWMRNLQVLQIFPLKQNGMVLTAGLNGSKGVVVGSPNEHAGGYLDTWLANLFAKRTDGSVSGSIYNGVIDVLASTEMVEIAARLRRQSNLPDPESSSGKEAILEDLMGQVAKSQMDLQGKGYNAMLMVGRTGLTDKNAYKNYAIVSTEGLALNTDIRENMIPLEYNIRLKTAMDRGYFKLIHLEQPTFDSPDPAVDEHAHMTIPMVLSGETRSINAMRTLSSNGKMIYDLPFLRKDAYFMIDEIMKKVEDTYSVDSEHWSDDNKIKQHPIVIHSALRIGENAWNCTGYAFRIQVVDTDLGKILTSIKDEQAAQFTKYGMTGKEYFYAAKYKDDTYDIVVYPPKDGYPRSEE